MNHRYNLVLSASVAVLALASAGGAKAQDAAAPAAATPQVATNLEEIVVTAQKRAENLQDVPVSIQTLSAKTLEQIGAVRLQDIERAVPAVSFGDGSEQGRYGIRGIVDYSRNAGYDARVGVYVDGVFMGRSWMNNQTLLGTQQVDVLRGPQGTLFGKNTNAGVIAITTKRPSATPEAEVVGEVGNFGHYRLAGRANMPLNDAWSLQASVAKVKSDGYYDNTLLDRRNMGVDSLAGRLQLRFHPNDDTDVNLSIDGVRDRNSTLHYTGRPAAGADPYQIRSYADDRADRDTGGASLTLDQRLGDLTLTSITAYRSGEQVLYFNNETGAANFLTIDLSQKTRQFSQELRLASSRKGVFDWVAGLYYFDQNNEDHGIQLAGPAFAALPAPFPAYANRQMPYGGKVHTQSLGAFANANYRPTEALEIGLGLRYTHERKALNDYFVADPLGIINGQIPDYDDDFSDGFLTPKANINYHLTDRTMLFASVARGFKSGGWNVEGMSQAQFDAGIRVGSETVTSYEAGLKSDLLDRRLRVNATVFLQKFKDFQVFSFASRTINNTTVLVSSLSNAGEVESRGLELDLTAVPIQGLTLSANYIYNDSKYTRFPGGGGLVGGVPLDANGVQTPYAPRNKAYLAADWRGPLMSWGDLFAHAGYSVQSSQNFDPKVIHPTFGPGYYIPGYELFDARIGVEASDGRWEVSIWGQNLADSEHIKFANRTAVIGVNAVLYDAPRTYGATVRVRF